MLKKILSIALLLSLASCASYNAEKLSLLSEGSKPVEAPASEVSVSWKAFDKEESKLYLGRDVLAKGYIPVQLTIRNNSQNSIYYSPENFYPSTAETQKVAKSVQTSTAGRVTGWASPFLLSPILWSVSWVFPPLAIVPALGLPLLVPAVYDGFKSSGANNYLNADYDSKSLREKTIQSHEILNGVVFVPRESVRDLSLTLVDTTTGERLLFVKN